MQKPAAEEQNVVQEGQDDENMQWRIIKRDYFMQASTKVTCAAFHAQSNLLVVGFSSGVFGLYDLPEFNQIHTLR